MVSTNLRSPIFWPARRYAACGAWLMLSWPPATTIALSPCLIAWTPSATLRRPEPHSWFTPQAGTSTGMPAATEAWRAGFWPWPAVRICPSTTSETSAGASLARSSAARIAASPR